LDERRIRFELSLTEDALNLDGLDSWAGIKVGEILNKEFVLRWNLISLNENNGAGAKQLFLR
jgi:hypothetical protein